MSAWHSAWIPELLAWAGVLVLGVRASLVNASLRLLLSLWLFRDKNDKEWQWNSGQWWCLVNFGGWWWIMQMMNDDASKKQMEKWERDTCLPDNGSRRKRKEYLWNQQSIISWIQCLIWWHCNWSSPSILNYNQTRTLSMPWPDGNLFQVRFKPVFELNQNASQL